MNFRQPLTVLFLVGLLPAIVFTKPYRGAELRTNEAYTYGRFSVRYQSAPGAGQTSTFFTYHDGGNDWNEIDIEILGRYTDDVQFNTITPGQTNHVSHSYTEFNPHIDFHTYAFEWTPDYVAWFVDGEEVHRQTGGHIATLVHPQKIMMNIWPPMYPGWVGDLDDRILPVFAYYDWVEYASYTPGEGDTGTGNNFTLQWHDDFDTWNQTRWSKATHTWGGNNSEFTPDNCVFQDGLMILCLTDEVNTGYQDPNRPTILWARATGNQVVAKFSEPVTQSTAETEANYSIPGVTISAAELQEDNQTVQLSTSGMDSDGSYNLVCFNVTDTPPGNNTLLGANVPVVMEWRPEFPIQINVGGDSLGRFIGDQLWAPTDNYGYEDGWSGVLPSGLDVFGTEQDSVYRTDHRGLVAYRIRLPNGAYPVRLMFSENQFTAEERRAFDIYLEGTQVADDLDLYDVAGPHTAYDILREEVEVADGVLDIFFSDVHHSEAILNGIDIGEPLSGTENHSGNIPPSFQTSPAYPNPFNTSTTFRYSLPSPGEVFAEILDIRGQRVATVLDRQMNQGEHLLRWHAGAVGSGIYFLRMEARIDKNYYSDTHKIVLLR